MTELEISIVIPTIPPRAALLERALKSVDRQRLQPTSLIIETDHDHTGAAATRQRGLEHVTTPYVAFLDDDDELLPHHLSSLATHLTETGADVVYPWFSVEGGGTDPFPERFGADFDEAALRVRNYVPINVLARTEDVLAAGGFQAEPNEQGWQNEDWRLWLALLDAGKTFSHFSGRTWLWHHWTYPNGRVGNTSGNPERW